MLYFDSYYRHSSYDGAPMFISRRKRAIEIPYDVFILVYSQGTEKVLDAGECGGDLSGYGYGFTRGF